MEILLKPFSWLLLIFYNFAGYGIALVLFGLVIKLVLFPVTLKSKKSMIQMSMLSGRLQQLQVQYGKDKERYNMEVQKLYAKEKVNPMGGCVWSLIPMFVLIALYGIVREPLRYLMDVPKDMIATVAEITGIANTGAFPQIAMAKALNDSSVLAAAQTALGDAGSKLFGMEFSFLGLDLAAIPSWKFWAGGLSWGSIGLFVLVLLSACISFISMQVSMATNKMNKSDDAASSQVETSNKVMTWMMPLMSLWIGFTVPAGLSVYWIAQYIVTMGQEVICGKMLKKDYEAARVAAAEAERQRREDEKRRKEEARLERARRIEEEKLNKKKNKGHKPAEKAEDGINRDDSREGIRAYARGRAYIPDRFGTDLEYHDPNELMRAAAEAANAAREQKAAKKKKKGKEDPKPVETQQETKPVSEIPAPAETPTEIPAEAPVETPAETPVETPVDAPAEAPAQDEKEGQ